MTIKLGDRFLEKQPFMSPKSLFIYKNALFIKFFK